jgi:hypothetical protein
MCIIANVINGIFNVKMFVSPNFNNTEQLVVFTVCVNNISDNNFIIIPVPKMEEMHFIDFSDYTPFFEECNSHFSTQKIFTLYNKTTNTTFLPKSFDNINFIKDYNLLKTTYNENINTQTLNFLQKNYENNKWSFIVLNIDYGIKKYISFGYIHKMQNNKLYIPTKQFRILNLETSPYLEKNNDTEYVLWDVELFLYNCKLLENFNYLKHEEFIWNKSFQINKKKINFNFNYTKHFEKIKINGNFKNTNLIAQTV